MKPISRRAKSDKGMYPSVPELNVANVAGNSEETQAVVNFKQRKPGNIKAKRRPIPRSVPKMGK